LPHFADANATMQSMIDSGIFMGGTVEEVRAQWRHIYSVLPSEYITLIWHYAQVPKEVLLEELDLFLRKVLPDLDAPSSVEQVAEAHPA